MLDSWGEKRTPYQKKYWELSMMFHTFVFENNRAKVCPKEKHFQMTGDIPSQMERKNVIIAHKGQ